ncbi:hypothetical protein [Flavobacterium sp. LHD-85]|uniref:hypothetical protein n=1 Tax=Flavobacterium sp. LHD-85 TaxID=3071410 RepID=UPI0027E0272F|nr:hypothetical protein [Flavobacterium sp. LHD-85]MDQ6530108.1 hypothetical protein [Flavobacterium sp. LHD-85]
MTNRTNKKENSQSDSIQNQFETSSSNKINLENTPFLYGMTIEQYKEGLEIHIHCFNQLEKIKKIMN